MEISQAEKDRVAALSSSDLDAELQQKGYTAYARRHPEYTDPDVKLDPHTLPDAGTPADILLTHVASDARRKFLVYLEEIGRLK